MVSESVIFGPSIAPNALLFPELHGPRHAKARLDTGYLVAPADSPFGKIGTSDLILIL